jgi:hypothetical protein
MESYLRLGILLTLIQSASQISFPFLVSRDYSYKQALGIKMSSEVTAVGRPYNFEDRRNSYWGKKDPSGRKSLSTPYDLKSLDFMCHPDHNTGEFHLEKSRTAGLVSNSNEVVNSPYEVDLYYALHAEDEETEEVLSGLGIPHCYSLCDKSWGKDQIAKFYDLVNKGYGYRMFLDDLPSATVMGDSTYYDTHVPLGYVRFRERPTRKQTEEGDENEDEKQKPSPWYKFNPSNLMPHVYIYNHLDIEVTIHETAATQVIPSTVHESTIDLDLSDIAKTKGLGKIKVPLPQSSVRIVGFTVKPRSIPNNVLCNSGLL